MSPADRSSPPHSSGRPPSLPCRATIASFEPGDGLGTVAVDGQPPMKFGGSACRGFEPAVGVTVEVIEAAPHPLGGWKATELNLKMDSAAYDELLRNRDQALGIHRDPLSPVEQAAATSQVLGWVVVLLTESPPRDPAAFTEWARKSGLQDAGIRVNAEGNFQLGFGKHDALAYVGDGPFPAARLAELGAPEDFDFGQGFIGLSLGIPGSVPLLRATDPSFDPWSENGPMRNLSKIALALSNHGPAVILPQAGTILSSEDFRTRLEDLNDLKARPFHAWAGFAVNPEQSVYSSYGLTLQAQPNITVDVDVSDAWELDRAREAILVASSTMVHGNRELQPGERLVVPVGQPVGALPISPMEGDTEIYVVEREEPDQSGVVETEIRHGASLSSGWLRLKRESRSGVRAGWAKTSLGRTPRVGLNTYQELLRLALSTRLDAFQFTGLSPELEADCPPFEIDVWEANSGDGYFMTSSGVGLLAQRFARPSDGTDHIEIVAAMQAHHPLIANLLAEVSAQVHLQTDASGVFKPGDTVGIALPEANAAGFVLSDAGSVVIAEGPQIHLLELIPLTQREYETARERGSGELLARLGKMSFAARAIRWKLSLAN